MSRPVVVRGAPARFWEEVGHAFRGFGNLFAPSAPVESGLEALERERDRIRLTSRHWLAG